MRRSLKIVGTVVFVFLLLIVVAVAYSTKHGYTTWWHRVSSGNVAVNGVRSGYLHRNSAHSAVIITRTDLAPAQSYLVGLSDSRWLIHCGEWHAPHFAAFPIGDVNPPSSIFGNGSDMPKADNPEPSTLTVRPEWSSTRYKARELQPRGEPNLVSWRNQLAEPGVSYNVGDVKHFLSIPTRALRRARHFALVEAVPYQPKARS